MSESENTDDEVSKDDSENESSDNSENESSEKSSNKSSDNSSNKSQKGGLSIFPFNSSEIKSTVSEKKNMRMIRRKI